MRYVIDIEPTNRCNASCHFCPRRDMTPHEGVMTPEVFDAALGRAVEYRHVIHDVLDGTAAISLCGLGEPLINKHLPEFVAKVRAADFPCTISSNGALLDERRGDELLDAGIQQIFINVGEEGDDYRDVYKLPFERTRDNVVRFAQKAEGRCHVTIVLVDHRRDRAHLRRMKEFWRGYGLDNFVVYDIINRGGALFVDHMQFESYEQLGVATDLLTGRLGKPAVCGAPFGYLFIGYDGQYYLCCSDWTKKTPMGSVFDESFLSVTRQKVEFAASRNPVCVTCNLDPTNRLTEQLKAVADGESDDATTASLVESLVADQTIVDGILDKLEPHLGGRRPGRRMIPVIAE